MQCCVWKGTLPGCNKLVCQAQTSSLVDGEWILDLRGGHLPAREYPEYISPVVSWIHNEHEEIT